MLCMLSLFVLIPEILMGAGAGMGGSDAFFHLARFTDAALQIKTGHFSYFQQFQTLHHSGKIVNALYGPLAAYLMGFLIVLVHFQGLVFWTLYLFLTNLVGSLSMYYLQRQLNVNKKIAFAMGGFFITTGAVTAPLSSSGMYALGYAVLPIIISAALRLLRDKNQPVKVWELTIGVTLLAQVHLLSLILGGSVYSLAFICFLFSRFKRPNFKQSLLKILQATGLILLLNFNIYGAYFEITGSNPNLAMPFRLDVMNWPAAVSFLRLNFGNLSGFLALILLMAFVLVFIHFRHEMWLTFALLMGVGFAFLAFSNLTLFSFETLFQFSARFLSVSLVFSLAILGYVLTNTSSKTLYHLMLAALFLTVGLYMVNSARSAQHFSQGKSLTDNQGAFTDTAARYAVLTDLSNFVDLNHLKETPAELTDYLINNTPGKEKEQNKTNAPALLLPYFYQDILSNQHFSGSELSQKTTQKGLTLSWKSNGSQKTTLPVIVYAHTQVILNGKKLEPKNYSYSYVGALQIHPKIGENQLEIFYRPSLLFMIGTFLQLLGILALMIYKVLAKCIHLSSHQTLQRR